MLNYHIRRLSVVGCLLMAWPVRPAPAQNAGQRDVVKLLDSGNDKLEKQDYDGAIADFTQVIQLGPKNTQGYIGRGRARFEKQDYDGAIADLTRAIELDSKASASYFVRANARFDAQDYTGAVEDYTQVLALDPKNADAVYYRGQVHARLGELDDALADYTRAIALNPKGEDALIARVLVHLWKKDFAALYAWAARIRLGEREAAVADLKKHLGTPVAGRELDWPCVIATFLTGGIDEGLLLQVAERKDENETRGRRCEALFYLGVKRLGDGDTKGAADAFKMCLDTQALGYFEHIGAQAELNRLGKKE